MSRERLARVMEQWRGEWKEHWVWSRWVVVPGCLVLTFMLGTFVSLASWVSWLTADRTTAVESVEVPLTVQDTLRTWYLGDAATFTKTLPCGSQYGYALPAGVMVAWCVDDDGHGWMTAAGSQDLWADLSEAEKRNWIDASFDLRRLIIDGPDDAQIGAVWRYYVWA